jgi:hypothetical protein
LTDLLADHQHWARGNGVPFGASLMRAQWHVAAEQIEGPAALNAVCKP